MPNPGWPGWTSWPAGSTSRTPPPPARSSIRPMGGAGLDPVAVARFRGRMDDDLDTPGALATVFELARRANAASDAGDAAGGARAARTVAFLCAALGLPLRAGTGGRRRDEH